MNRKKISLALFLITVILGVICMVSLPSTIAVHWDSMGTANGFLPTYQAVLIAIGATLLCLVAWALLSYSFQSRPAISVAVGQNGGKIINAVINTFGFVFSCSGIVVNLAILFMN